MDDDILEFTGQYRFLSNFWEAPVKMDGAWYPTVEHAYQASKSLDPIIRLTISRYKPGQAKRAGRNIPLRPDWEMIKISQMHLLLYEKFTTHPDLGLMLIDTYPKLLVESNRWHDCFWGACLCRECLTKPKLNHLGNLLADVRRLLIERSLK